MVADNQPSSSTIWNIFFHMYLDGDSHLALVEQCKKLIGFSENLQQWDASPYGSFMKMSTEYTLTELRRHWSLYLNMQNLPREQLKAIRHAFVKESQYLKDLFVSSSARSSGPLMVNAIQVTAKQFQNYKATGVAFSDPKHIAAATLFNPTFAYSLAGEGCAVHYGTDPLVPFHLAALFGNTKGPVSVADAVHAAQTEFSDWCSAFRVSISSTTPVIRFFLGEALVVCSALRAFATAGELNLGVPIAPWKTQLIQLNKAEYVLRSAPITFNVIETSNLSDHLGLLNVLIATAPLLSTSTQSSVLYTESLVPRGQEATKELVERLYMDITTIGVLFGLCPVDYLSSFATRSNVHELLAYLALQEGADTVQFHQVTTWKSPISGDAVAIRDGALRQPLIFDPHQLGTLLYDLYQELFARDGLAFFAKQKDIKKAVYNSNIIHYTRESFVLLLKFVKERSDISEQRWLAVIDRIFDLNHADTSLLQDQNNYQDLCGQLHRHGVYTVPIYHKQLQRVGPFSSWGTLPPLVRIILAVPREKLTALESEESIGTPPLHCDVRGCRTHNMFSAVHVAFGQVISTGTKSHPRVMINEDLKGWKGTSPLVTSFVIPTLILTDVGPIDDFSVSLSVLNTPLASKLLARKLGPWLNIFTAKVTDTSHVWVLPEYPLPYKKPRTPSSASPSVLPTQIGKSDPVVVELDEECELIASLTCRISVENKQVKQEFGSGATPTIKQVSPCVMKIIIGNHAQDVLYPFPVIGSQCKLRLARKSSYIEAVVPVSGPFQPDGMKLNPFPVSLTPDFVNPWNVHRLNLSRLPILDVKGKDLGVWLNAHLGAAMSSRERSLRKKHKTDALMFIKDTLHAIFVQSSGIQSATPHRVFSLHDTTKNSDTIFFISDLRYDLHSHTWGMMTVKVLEGEMRSWKQLLPAFVERCRTWTHGDNCEYRSQGKIPLTEVMEEDPLCSCGRGKDTEGMSKVPLWREFAPYVTRVALSPLFAVSYLEREERGPEDHDVRRMQEGTILLQGVPKEGLEVAQRKMQVLIDDSYSRTSTRMVLFSSGDKL
ncbi:hypothetical protein BOTBODRAFT_147955 [Botryobasidium botryosum FD-172 SS1]|uniref:Uncharacterized protein n=1 Tax=Botryobasidium botryosum (strain FD-172 SS1) TaxID=930990 RepID=A0A067M2M6_BOTB1|nr:hypothetical protein BOTBODRAFT_147955 [Botryobasidium botryosum FD-172 SS1]